MAGAAETEYTEDRALLPGKYCLRTSHLLIIIELVDSISRDGPDMPIYVIHYKMPKIWQPSTFKLS